MQLARPHGEASSPMRPCLGSSRAFGLVVLLGSILLSAVASPAAETDPVATARLALPEAGVSIPACDTLTCDLDPSGDAQECLTGLRWSPQSFAVEIGSAVGSHGDRMLYFPSPLPAGNAIHDRVAVEWYAAQGEAGELLNAPAVVVVHESGRSMPVGRLIARGLRGHGIHALMLQLPGYGERRTELADRPERMLDWLRQGIADVRRARDVAAVLPGVDTSRIGVQGTSLGGFVTSTVAGLDNGFDRVFILLAGGQLDRVVNEGKKDAAKIREQLERLGIRAEQVAELARPIEPLRLAHRIDPERTWLYNGAFDDVVPRSSSYALAKAARLPDSHHIELPANHYTGIIFLPVVLQQIRDEMTR
ncbi:MAG: alpha/beta fold hydrolase [Planctomycetaceae bacterium]|nr:MAG: alpha/beta fold hydrolase [Planctomycetaceae bacterium]